MADGILDERRRALEESFFRKENERLRARLQAERDRQATREALAGEFGPEYKSLLDQLVDLGIHVETVEALLLAPLALVAWADGKMDARERDAVLHGVEASGIPRGSPAYELLDSWTQQRPPPAVMESWRAYVAALLKDLSADQRWALEERVLGRARAVAQAAGGFLGMASVSREEEAVLAELASVFEN